MEIPSQLQAWAWTHTSRQKEETSEISANQQVLNKTGQQQLRVRGVGQLQTRVLPCRGFGESTELCTGCFQRFYLSACGASHQSVQGCCWQFSAVKVAVKSWISLKSGSLNSEMSYKDVFKKDEQVSKFLITYQGGVFSRGRLCNYAKQ